MRDNSHYRAANTRAQAGASPSFACLRRAEKPSPETGSPLIGQRERPAVRRAHVHGRVDVAGDEWIGIHSNGIDTNPMKCIRSGMDWYSMHWIPLHNNRPIPWPGTGPWKWTKGSGGLFTTMPARSQITWR